jgi:LPXTG-motif cell wall-anchored protein
MGELQQESCEMRMRFPLAVGLAAGLALIPGTALAHHPEIKASQACDGLVKWTAEAWENDDADRRVNDKIEIRIFGEGLPTAGKVVTIGEFNEDNDYKFSGVYQLSEPVKVTVKATSLVRWGEDAERGDLNEFREDTAQPDEDCDSGEVITAPETTTPQLIDISPDATVPGEAGDPPTLASPAAVEGEQLPFTGNNTVPLLIAGLVLLAAGIWILRHGRRAGHSD